MKVTPELAGPLFLSCFTGIEEGESLTRQAVLKGFIAFLSVKMQTTAVLLFCWPTRSYNVFTMGLRPL